MGTDGSWPASRSARSHPGRATLAWTATRRSASVRGGFRRRRRSRRARAFCDRAPPGRRARTRLGLWACLLGGRDATRGCRDPHRGGPPARRRVARARRGRRRRRIWCGWRCVPCRRPRARGPARGSPRRRARRRRGRRRAGRVLSLGLERAERGDGLGRVGDRSGEFLRRSRRRVAATPAKESREEREDQRGRGERNHPHPNVDGTTRARRGARAPGPRPTKLMRETRRRSSLLDMCLAKNRHQDTLRQTCTFFSALPGTTNRSPLYAALRHPNPSC